MASFTCPESCQGWLEGWAALAALPLCSPLRRSPFHRVSLSGSLVECATVYSALQDTNPEAFWISEVKCRAGHIFFVLFFYGCKQLHISQIQEEVRAPFSGPLATNVFKGVFPLIGNVPALLYVTSGIYEFFVFLL